MTPNTIHNGECLKWLQGLPDAIADAVITDPPYSSGGAFRSDRAATSTNGKYLSAGGREKYPEFSGDSRDQRAYAYWCLGAFAYSANMAYGAAMDPCP
jgi:site-specific DNA-methyltransferase (adenine-specific)